MKCLGQEDWRILCLCMVNFRFYPRELDIKKDLAGVDRSHVQSMGAGLGPTCNGEKRHGGAYPMGMLKDRSYSFQFIESILLLSASLDVDVLALHLTAGSHFEHSLDPFHPRLSGPSDGGSGASIFAQQP